MYTLSAHVKKYLTCLSQHFIKDDDLNILPSAPWWFFFFKIYIFLQYDKISAFLQSLVNTCWNVLSASQLRQQVNYWYPNYDGHISSVLHKQWCRCSDKTSYFVKASHPEDRHEIGVGSNNSRVLLTPETWPFWVVHMHSNHK